MSKCDEVLKTLLHVLVRLAIVIEVVVNPPVVKIGRATNRRFDVRDQQVDWLLYIKLSFQSTRQFSVVLRKRHDQLHQVCLREFLQRLFDQGKPIRLGQLARRLLASRHHRGIPFTTVARQSLAGLF